LPLKSQAARERWAPEKGLKDRIDVLSLLLYSDWKPEIFTDLIRKFDPASHHVNVLLRTVKENRVEYSYLGLRYEREGRKLRSTINKLLTITERAQAPDFSRGVSMNLPTSVEERVNSSGLLGNVNKPTDMWRI